MKKTEQQKAFSKDLDKLIERYAQEFDLTHEDMMGILTFKIHELFRWSQEDDGEKEYYLKP